MNRQHYIYLLQTREFVNSNQPLYKIGKTKQSNLTRFNSYDKGSILLLQSICYNCDVIEKELINIFKVNFIQRTDIGTETFEGDYKIMIKMINEAISNEQYIDNLTEEIKQDILLTKIKTFNEYKNNNSGISDVIITNKKTKEGYLKLKNSSLWHTLYNPDILGFDENNHETLIGFIKYYANIIDIEKKYDDLLDDLLDEHQYWIEYVNEDTGVIINNLEYELINNSFNKLLEDDIIDKSIIRDHPYWKYSPSKEKLTQEELLNCIFDFDAIISDILQSCYSKKVVFYNIKYEEYIVSNTEIFNSSDIKCYKINDIIPNNEIILLNNYTNITCSDFNDLDIKIVNNMLVQLLNKDCIQNYKNFCYNIFVKHSPNIIILLDNSPFLLTNWIEAICYSLSLKEGVDFLKYYEKDTISKHKIDNTKIRFVIIYDNNKLLNKIQDKGITKIIKCQKNKNIYDKDKFIKYLEDNKDDINKHCIDKDFYNHKDIEAIFYYSKYMRLNLFKWFLTK